MSTDYPQAWCKQCVCMWMQAVDAFKELITLITWDHRPKRQFPKNPEITRNSFLGCGLPPESVEELWILKIFKDLMKSLIFSHSNLWI